MEFEDVTIGGSHDGGRKVRLVLDYQLGKELSSKREKCLKTCLYCTRLRS